MKRYFFSFFIILSIAIIGSCGTPIEEYQAKNNDEKEIIDVLIKFTEVVNLGDTEEVLKLFHEKGEYVTGRGRVSIPRYELAKRKPEDWLDDGLRKFYNPEIDIKGNEAKVLLQARFGNYKTPKLFTFIKENGRWIIMKRE
jgi:hypothetical protein